jgi:hypothetical protein
MIPLHNNLYDMLLYATGVIYRWSILSYDLCHIRDNAEEPVIVAVNMTDTPIDTLPT